MDLSPPSLDFDDTIEYLHPTEHYETDGFNELHQVAWSILEGDDCYEDLREQLDALTENYGDFERQHMRPLLEALINEVRENSQDPFPRQLSYVLETGYKLFYQGGQMCLRWLDAPDPTPEELLDALYTLGEGHDYIYFGIELASGRAESTQP